MSLGNHLAGFRQATLYLFQECVAVANYPPCNEIFQGLPYPPSPEVVPAGFEENYYQYYFAIAEVLRPRTYLEIGTRFGYSTVAVSRGAKGLRRIVSCDLETYENPAGIPTQQVAEANLRASGYSHEAVFIADDSRRLMHYVSGETFDLILVDGDHSYEGCLADLTTCSALMAPGGVLMVDDIDQPPVFEAVRDWMRQANISAGSQSFIPTKHGLMLVRLPGNA